MLYAYIIGVANPGGKGDCNPFIILALIFVNLELAIVWKLIPLLDLV